MVRFIFRVDIFSPKKIYDFIEKRSKESVCLLNYSSIETFSNKMNPTNGNPTCSSMLQLFLAFKDIMTFVLDVLKKLFTSLFEIKLFLVFFVFFSFCVKAVLSLK